MSQNIYALNMSKRGLQHWLHDESGQAIIEFVALAAISIAIVGTLKAIINNFTITIWSGMAKRIAAPCADIRACRAGEEFDL